MIIVWGATTKLVAESEAMQAEIKRLKPLTAVIKGGKKMFTV